MVQEQSLATVCTSRPIKTHCAWHVLLTRVNTAERYCRTPAKRTDEGAAVSVVSTRTRTRSIHHRAGTHSRRFRTEVTDPRPNHHTRDVRSAYDANVSPVQQRPQVRGGTAPCGAIRKEAQSVRGGLPLVRLVVRQVRTGVSRSHKCTPAQPTLHRNRWAADMLEGNISYIDTSGPER
jgi:hypothetical protein